jgi:hypothetical protein
MTSVLAFSNKSSMFSENILKGFFAITLKKGDKITATVCKPLEFYVL